MKPFIKAIMTRALTFTGYGGRVFYEMAIGEPVFEYLVVNQNINVGPAYQTGGDIVEDRSIIFNSYSDQADTVLDCMGEIEKSFEGTLLELDEGKVLASFVASTNMIIDPERAERGKEVYHGIVNIEFKVQRSLVL